jgi:hypothetical protein
MIRFAICCSHASRVFNFIISAIFLDGVFSFALLDGFRLPEGSQTLWSFQRWISAFCVPLEAAE